MDEALLLTISEAAKRLSIGRSHAYAYVMRGDLPSIKLGRSRRVSVEAVSAFIQRLQAAECEAWSTRSY